MIGPITRLSTAALVLGATLGLAACENMKATLTGDAAMRIDVDVYKGPLALDPEIQWGQLLGYVQEANVAIDHYINVLMLDLKQRHGSFPKFFESTEEFDQRHPKDVCKLRDAQALYAQIPSRALYKKKGEKYLGYKNAKTDFENEKGPTLLEQFSALFSWDSKQKLKKDYKVYYTKREKLNKAKKALKTVEDKRSQEAETGADTPELVRLLWDACDVWKITRATHAAALIWTEKFQKYRGFVEQAVRDTGNSEGNNPKLKKIRSKLNQSDPLENNPDKWRGLRAVLTNFAEVGARFKTKASYWAHNHAIAANEDRSIRGLITGFQLIAAEYSNRIISASDALAKQTYLGDRREMPISTLLRDTKSTAFVNLLVFNNAGNSGLPHEAEFTKDYLYDRVRMIEQLADDDAWSNVNRAFASGRGDSAMAFVKDDIGNWNLKNFDSDPSEVIDTYKKVGMAALKTAVELASDASGVGGAQKLLTLASQVTMGAGGGDPAPEQKHITVLHKGIGDSLKTLKTDVTAQEKSLKKQVDTKTAELAKKQKEAEGPRSEVAALLKQNNKLRPLPVSEMRVEARLAERDAQRLRERAKAVEGDQKTQFETEAGDSEAEATAWRELATATEKRDALEKEIKTLQASIAKAKKTLANLPEKTKAQAMLLLNTHRNFINSLEAAAVRKADGTDKTIPVSLPSTTVPKIPVSIHGSK